jgi:serine protease AprX
MFIKKLLLPFSLGSYQLYSVLVVTLLLTTIPALRLEAEGIVHAQPVLLQIASQHPDEQINVIVQKQVTDSEVEALVSRLGGVVSGDLHIINAFTAKLPARTVPELARQSGVKWISLDAPVVKSGQSVSTTNLKNHYNKAIKVDQVWKNLPALQGDNIGVAVVDSGINWNGDFYTVMGTNRIVAAVSYNNGWNQTTWDGYAHGTHVAGIIGGTGASFTSDANGNPMMNGSYIGIAPNTNLINVKVTDDYGGSNASNVVAGLQWINDHRSQYNIRVVNISLNSTVNESCNVNPLCAAAEILWFNGIVVVVSVGNDGTGGVLPPANDPFVISVGATDDKGTDSLSDDTLASFSAYGMTKDGFAKPDLVAPGTNIVGPLASTSDMLPTNHPANVVNNGYMRMSGTSMAAPMVAGAAALLLQAEPTLNPDQVKYRLMATAVQNQPRWTGDSRPTWGNYNSSKAGAGYLDVYAALTNKLIGNSPNYGKPASKLLWTGSQPITWSSVNWSSVNWSSVNWSSVNWSSVNWSSDYWGS